MRLDSIRLSRASAQSYATIAGMVRFLCPVHRTPQRTNRPRGVVSSGLRSSAITGCRSRLTKLVRVGLLTLLLVMGVPTLAVAGATRTTGKTPVIRKLSPSSETEVGGQRVTVYGKDFKHVQLVSFGSRSATKVRVLSTHKLTAVAPAHPAGRVNVSVLLRPWAESPVTKKVHFTFTPDPPPSIDSTPPRAAPIPTPLVPTGPSGPNPIGYCIGSLPYCGSTMEGLAPPSLPDNWSSLSDTQQAFVLIDLERVERGETPIVGESAALDADAAQGAQEGTDPSGASAANFASIVDSVAALTLYLYDDGNEGWIHRDNILEAPNDPYLAVGLADGAMGSAEAFADNYQDYTFTWAQELAAGYPQGLPMSFALSPTPPTLTSVSQTKPGARSVTLTGTGLNTASIYFANVSASGADCNDAGTVCRVTVIPKLAPNVTYSIYAQNPIGTTAANLAETYTSGL
jgi:hypothetical protein